MFFLNVKHTEDFFYFNFKNSKKEKLEKWYYLHVDDFF